MARQRKYWYLKNPYLRALGVTALAVSLYVPIAFATSSPTEVEDKSEGSAFTNDLVSLKTTINLVEEEQMNQQTKLLIDIGDLKAERDSLEQDKQQLEQELEKVKAQLDQQEEAKKQAELKKQQEQQKLAEQKKQQEQQQQTKSVNTVQGKTITAVATAYTAYCNGCSGKTATGINLRANPSAKVIAVDPRVIPLHSKVEVFYNGKSKGVYTAADTGGSIKGNKIDIFMPSKTDAYNWGRKTVTLKVLN